MKGGKQVTARERESGVSMVGEREVGKRMHQRLRERLRKSVKIVSSFRFA